MYRFLQLPSSRDFEYIEIIPGFIISFKEKNNVELLGSVLT